MEENFSRMKVSVKKAHFIFYVADQRLSTTFYSSVLGVSPSLDVPGMTEFELGRSAVLGLMPEDGIARLLGDRIVHPSQARGVPRAELYLVVDDAAEVHARIVASGGVELSPPMLRDWGHLVAYSLDPDHHVLAVASLV